MSTTGTDEAILAAAGRVAEPPRPIPFAFAKRQTREAADGDVLAVGDDGREGAESVIQAQPALVHQLQRDGADK